MVGSAGPQSRGLCAQRLVARDGNRAYYNGYHYQLVRRSGGDAVAVNGNDASLVQLWRRTAVPAPVAPAPVVPPHPPFWAQCRVRQVARAAGQRFGRFLVRRLEVWRHRSLVLEGRVLARGPDCACHRRAGDGEVVSVSPAGAITATYCSAAGAAVAHVWLGAAQRRCSSKALSKRTIESSAPPILRYATAWDGEIKRRETAKAAAEKRKVAQQAAAA